MADKKVLLWPSARSRYLKHEHMQIIQYALYVLVAVMVLQNYYLYAFMYGVKLLLMVLVSILVTKEVEILFYTHDKDISRAEAKELIVKSYPVITAMIYALMIPVGTPLWLVALGAGLATLLGKLLFGGFHHMVFHSSLVGVIVVTLGWAQIVDGVAFMTSFDNYILELLFDNPFFNDTLAIGGIYDPASHVTALGMLQDGVTHTGVFQTSFGSYLSLEHYPMIEMMLGVVPGIIGSGLVMLGMLLYFSIKKIINWVLPLTMIVAFLLTAFVATLIQGEDLYMPLYHLFAGSFLFVVLFVTSDPITTPIPLYGKIVFGVIAGAVTYFIRIAGTHEEGVLFATLFMMMLTPMLNEIFKEKKKVVKKPTAPKKAGAEA